MVKKEREKCWDLGQTIFLACSCAHMVSCSYGICDSTYVHVQTLSQSLNPCSVTPISLPPALFSSHATGARETYSEGQTKICPSLYVGVTELNWLNSLLSINSAHLLHWRASLFLEFLEVVVTFVGQRTRV